jgi:hypothetical protein
MRDYVWCVLRWHTYEFAIKNEVVRQHGLPFVPEQNGRSCLQIVDLLTWRADMGPQMTSLWEIKDSLQRSEIAGILEDAESGQVFCSDASSNASSARVMAILFCYSLTERAGISGRSCQLLMQQEFLQTGISGNSLEQSGHFSRSPTAEAAVATSAGSLLLERLVAIMQQDAAVQSTVQFKGSDVHRKKVRIWQALAVLSPFCQANSSALQIADVINQLKQGDLASVKQYQETGAVLSLFVYFGFFSKIKRHMCSCVFFFDLFFNQERRVFHACHT